MELQKATKQVKELVEKYKLSHNTDGSYKPSLKKKIFLVWFKFFNYRIIKACKATGISHTTYLKWLKQKSFYNAVIDVEFEIRQKEMTEVNNAILKLAKGFEKNQTIIQTNSFDKIIKKITKTKYYPPNVPAAEYINKDFEKFKDTKLAKKTHEETTINFIRRPYVDGEKECQK